MAEKESKKKGFLGKFFDVLSGSPVPTGKPEDEHGKFAPEEKEPDHVRFVRQFTESGGFFIYCGTKTEVIDALNDILEEHNLLGIGSPDENVLTLLKQLNINRVNQKVKECDTICTYCESMIAFNGGIMMTENQTNGLKIDQMPKYHIILGKTSQIVEKLSDAMGRINQHYRNNRPAQISQLRAPNDEQVRIANADPNKGRVLFVLLIEDLLWGVNLLPVPFGGSFMPL